MKALIIAFPRSGTSLTFRLLSNHPEIERGFFETKLLRKFPDKRRLLNLYEVFDKERNCVEKIIYEGATFGSGTKHTPQLYCARWNHFFSDEARIIQIIRHPKDVWNSLLLKEFIKRKWTHLIIPRLNMYFDSFGRILNDIDYYNNCLTIKYEDLILNLKPMSQKIYEFCDLSPFDFEERMKTRKVFLYKEIGMRIDIDSRLKQYREEFNKIFYKRLPGMVELLNKFSGIKYET